MIVYTTYPQLIGLREALMRSPDSVYSITKAWLKWQGVREIHPFHKYEIVVDSAKAMTSDPAFSGTPFADV